MANSFPFLLQDSHRHSGCSIKRQVLIKAIPFFFLGLHKACEARRAGSKDGSNILEDHFVHISHCSLYAVRHLGSSLLSLYELDSIMGMIFQLYFSFASESTCPSFRGSWGNCPSFASVLGQYKDPHPLVLHAS